VTLTELTTAESAALADLVDPTSLRLRTQTKRRRFVLRFASRSPQRSIFV
jgi:hypothetical protein